MEDCSWTFGELANLRMRTALPIFVMLRGTAFLHTLTVNHYTFVTIFFNDRFEILTEEDHVGVH